MCHSAESSIRNYIITLLVASILAYAGDAVDRHVALAFAVIIHMQLSEYFMWLDQSCGRINHLATYSALFVLWLQPIVILFGGFWLNTTTLLFKPALLFASLFTLIIGTRFVQLAWNSKKRCSRPGPRNLVWDLNNTERSPIFLIPYLIMLIGSWLFLKDKIKGIFLFGLFGISFIHHYLKYKKEWPSNWCYATRNGFIYYTLFSAGVKLFSHLSTRQ